MIDKLTNIDEIKPIFEKKIKIAYIFLKYML